MSDAAPIAPDPDLRARFLAGMSHAASTVNVVTTDGAAGRSGVTVSAMTSVSADTARPTLLVCVHQMSPAAEAILANGVFCVNVLRDDQSYISDAFAGRFKDDLADKFACTDWVDGGTGAPRVADPLVAFDCRLVSGDRVGTHHVMIGEVEDIHAAARGSALIYANRSYGRTARIDPVQSLAAGTAAEGAELRLGCFQTFGPYLLPALLARFSDGRDLRMKLVEGDHRRTLESLKSGESDLALMYDFGLGPDVEAEPLSARPPYALLPGDHPLASRETLSLRDLAQTPMVLLSSPPSEDYFLSLFADHGLAPDVVCRAQSVEMVRGLVAQGIGFSILATRPAGDVSYAGRPLAARPLAETLPPSTIVLARRRGAAQPPIAAEFAALCRSHFKEA